MCRFYTAGCVNKMVVSVTGPRAVRRPSHTGYTLMSIYSHRFCSDIHAPAAALCVTETGVLATKLQDVFADVFYVRLLLDLSGR